MLLIVAALVAPRAHADPKTPKARATIPTPPRSTSVDLTRSDGPRSVPTAREKLREQIEEILGRRYLTHGTTAILAVDAETGEVIYSKNARRKLNPASNVKLFSTATVLDIVGTGFRYRTRLVGATPDESGLVSGDLYLLGAGDPTFFHDELASLVDDLVSRGVKKIAGDLVLSEDRYRDNLAIPRLRIDAVGARRRGKATITITPATDFVEIVNRTRTARSRRARIRASGKLVTRDGAKKWVVTVTGTVPPRRRRVTRIAAPLRSTFTGHALAAVLARAGVEVGGEVTLGEFEDFVTRSAEAGQLPVQLAEHRSAPMRDLVKLVNKRSINFLADRLIMTAALDARGGKMSMKNAIETMDAFIDRVGLDARDLVLDTGSGLSYNTKLTAEQIVHILRVGAGFIPGSRGDPQTFVKSLTVGGRDGTLRRRFRSSAARGRVRGKTGTLTRCLALSGFVTADDGRTLAFAIVTNKNRRRDRTGVRREHEALVEAMFAYSKVAPAVVKTGIAAAAPTVADDVAEADDERAGDELGDETGGDDGD
jgi:D-alanyl-D-alanine carboxypeptidase/D-alanyl-D-alanine-endopeptidase (penicillin-binding protein 4)